MSHHTKDKGDIALTYVIAHLTTLGISCCTPLSEHLPFDFIAVNSDHIGLRRVQVKYRTPINGYIQLKLSNSYNDLNGTKNIHHDFSKFDCYALFIPDYNKFYYINTNELDEKRHSYIIRIDHENKNQTMNMNFGEYFEDPLRIFKSFEENEDIKDEIFRNICDKKDNQLYQQNLDKNSFGKCKLSKQQLQNLIQTNSPEEISKIYNVHPKNVRKWLRQAGISKEGYYWNNI